MKKLLCVLLAAAMLAGLAAFAVSAEDEQAPAITGPTSLTIREGYSSTNIVSIDGVGFNVTGNPKPTVTNTYAYGSHGIMLVELPDGRWAMSIRDGLSYGTYGAEFIASNGVEPDAKFTFTLYVEKDGFSLSPEFAELIMRLVNLMMWIARYIFFGWIWM